MTTISSAPLDAAHWHEGHESTTCRVFRHGSPSADPHDLEQISDILQEEGALVWLDVVDPGPNDLDLIKEEFHLHPLAVEDAIKAHQRPKIESFGEYWFVIILGVTLKADDLVFHEVAIFAGKNFLVTVRDAPPYPLNEVEERWRAHPERLRRGGGFLLYTILDTIVDGYFPVADHFDDRADVIEDAMFDATSNQREVMPQIFNMKRVLSEFRRAVLPMRDTLNPIIREDIELFAQDEMVYFRDVYDHAVRIVEQIDSIRDIVTSTLDMHLSMVANKQNEVAKQLTIIATIFLPLSFLASFFGQNFSFMVGHIGGAAHFWILGVGTEVVALTLTLSYFKVKGWF